MLILFDAFWIILEAFSKNFRRRATTLVGRRIDTHISSTYVHQWTVSIVSQLSTQACCCWAKNVVVLQYSNDISEDTAFKQLVSTCGYVTTRVTGNSSKYKYTITLEPKFPGEVPSNLVPTHVFHVSPSFNRNKILSVGVSPKTSRTSLHHTGDRIYLLVTSSPSTDVLRLITILKRARQHQNEMYDVFQIITNTDHTYYYDPSYQLGDASLTSYAIFSLRNIATHQIKLVGSV